MDNWELLCVCNSFLAGDVHLAKCKEIVAAWWGSGNPPSDHALSEDPDTNSIMCFPQEEDTMVTEESDGHGWIGYLLSHGVQKVADVYSAAGVYMHV